MQAVGQWRRRTEGEVPREGYSPHPGSHAGADGISEERGAEGVRDSQWMGEDRGSRSVGGGFCDGEGGVRPAVHVRVREGARVQPSGVPGPRQCETASLHLQVQLQKP